MLKPARPELNNLKTCPFCGNAPTTTPWHGGGPLKSAVFCDNETCDLQPMVTGLTLAKAVARWNKREALGPAAPVKPDFVDRLMMKAGLSTGDEGTFALAAQLAGVPACPACGYRKEFCRCNADPAQQAHRKRERIYLMAWAMMTLSTRPELSWLSLLKWAALGGKPDEVPQ